MPNHASAVLGLVLAAFPTLAGADVFSTIDRVLGLASGGFNADTLGDYEVGKDANFGPSSDGDSDLGEQFILRRQPDRAPVKGRIHSDVFWSNNLTSASTNEIEGFFWANTIEVAWRPKIADKSFLEAHIAEDIYFYEAGLLNFESTRAALGLIRNIPSMGNLSLYARYEFLYSHANNPSYPVFAANDHLNDHFHRLRIGANRPLFIGKKDTAFLALDAAFDLDADPHTLEKCEYAALLGYTHSFSDALKFSAFYRLARADYRNTARKDWNQIIGIELSYAFSASVRCHTSLLYAHNDSNTPLGFDDYEVLQSGLGVGLTADF